jgi:hypothetical protein
MTKAHLLLDWLFDQFVYPVFAGSIGRAREGSMPPDQWCKVPPPGWWCSRDPGHEGPCAARPKRSPSGTRFYGDGGTIHDSGHIDVAVDKDGRVREVMFRCMWLPFSQVSFDELRHDGEAVPMPRTKIAGVVIRNR